jgi:hypothetical protein
MEKKQTKKLIALALVTPLATGSLVQTGVAFAAGTAPGPVTNPTIDWETFSHDTITLLWDPVPGATEYVVERNGVEVYRGPYTTFTDTGLAAGATYQYAIFAANSYGMSDPVVDYITTDEVYQAITINWLTIPNAVQYRIERNGIEIATVDAPTLTYTDETALLGNKYRYNVVPIYADGSEGDPVDLGEIIPIENNQAPISTGIPDITVEEGSSKTIDLDNYFSDPDGDILSYTAEASNANASASTSGAQLVVVGLKEGTSTVVVTARDGKGGIVQRAVNVQVEAKQDTTTPTDPTGSDNAAPIVSTIPEQTVEVGSSKTINLNNYFTDPDGDELFYTVTTNNNNVTKSLSGSTLTLTGATEGTTTVTVTADDKKGHTVTTTFITTVTASTSGTGGTNNAPIALTIPDQTITETESKTLDLSLYFSDPDGDKLTYNVNTSNGNVTASVSGSTLTLTGATTGVSTVTVTANDGKGAFVEREFVVYVNPLTEEDENDPEVGEEPDQLPVSYDMPDLAVTIGASKTVDLSQYFQDPDGDSLNYNVQLSNGNVTHSVTGSILTITGVKVGNTIVTVTADDGKGNTVSETFTATVTDTTTSDDTPTNQAPTARTIPDGTVKVGESKNVLLDNYFSDPDGDNLTYTVTSNNSNIIKTLSGSTLNIKGNREGTSVITVTAKDPSGLSVKQSFTVTVEANTSPRIPYTPVDVIYGKDYVEIEWYPILGAAKYQVFLNDQLVLEQPEDGSPYYYYRAEDLDPNVQNKIEVQPVAGDGTPIGDPIEFDDIDELSGFEVYATVNENDVTVSWNSEFTAEGYQVSFKDANGNVIYSKEVSANTNSLTYRVEKAGNYTVVVSPKVNGEYSAGKTAEFVIAKDYVVNHAPTVVEGGIPSITLTTKDQPYKFDVSKFFTDADGDQLTYEIASVSNTNASATIQGTEITVTPNSVGTTLVKVKVSDGKGGTVDQLFYVLVKEPVNHAPVSLEIPDQVMNIDAQPLVLNALNYFTDEDGDPLVVSVKSVSSSNVTAKSDGSNVTITPVKVGNAIVTLLATDTKGLTVQKSFKVTVNEVAPAQVRNLKAEATAYNQVQLSFDAVSNADEYIIKRDSVEIERTTATTYVDKTVQPKTTYTYEVIAVNEVGESAPVSGTVETPEIPTVQNVVATAEGKTITVTWDPLEGSAKYKVQRYKKDADGTFKADGFARTSSETTFVDTNNIQAGTEYKYEIIPLVGNVYKPEYAGYATVTTAAEAPDTPPEEEVDNTVKNVTVTLNGTIATVTWDQLTEDGKPVTSYRLQKYVKDDTGQYVKDGAPVAVKDATTKDFTVLEGKTYKFEVVPQIDIYRPELAGYAEITVPAADPVETTPPAEEDPDVDKVELQGLTITNDGLVNTLNWSVINGSGRYRVYRYVKVNGVYKQDVFVRTTDKTTFVDTLRLKPNTEYTYVVVPFNGRFYDVSLAIKGVVTTGEDPNVAPPVQEVEESVQNVTATKNGTVIDVAWSQLTVNGTPVTYYRVQRWSKDANGQYVKDGTATTLNGLQFKDTRPVAGKQYKYEIIPRVGSVYDTSKAGTVEIIF